MPIVNSINTGTQNLGNLTTHSSRWAGYSIRDLGQTIKNGWNAGVNGVSYLAVKVWGFIQPVMNFIWRGLISPVGMATTGLIAGGGLLYSACAQTNTVKKVVLGISGIAVAAAGVVGSLVKGGVLTLPTSSAV